MSRELMLTGDTPLAVTDAAAAIIRVEADGYLMQLRDARSDIWYPDHWGLFGGGMEPGEDPLQALKRELREELELEFTQADFFARIDFDLGGLGLQRYHRTYYVVPITRAEEARLVLHEGAAKRVFPGADILREPNVTPHDAFVLFLHHGKLAEKGRATDNGGPGAGIRFSVQLLAVSSPRRCGVQKPLAFAIVGAAHRITRCGQRIILRHCQRTRLSATSS